MVKVSFAVFTVKVNPPATVILKEPLWFVPAESVIVSLMVAVLPLTLISSLIFVMEVSLEALIWFQLWPLKTAKIFTGVEVVPLIY